MGKSGGYDTQFSKIDTEHAARNRGRDESNMSQPAGGSAKFTDPGPKGKSPSMGGSADVKKLGKLSGGRPDTAKPSKTVA